MRADLVEPLGEGASPTFVLVNDAAGACDIAGDVLRGRDRWLCMDVVEGIGECGEASQTFVLAIQIDT